MMVAMNHGLVALLLCASLPAAVQARAFTLPDACGDDRVMFDVKTEKNQPPPAPPADGRAQIVFFEIQNGSVAKGITVRFGMDGAWVGANHGNSYFALDLAPGEHHLCADWQSRFAGVRATADVTSFTAEPGKVYYFAAQATFGQSGLVTTLSSFSLSPLNEDAGKYRLRTWQLATSKPKK